MSTSYGLYFELDSLSVLYIYCSTKRLYIHYDLLLQQHFYSRLLLFYVHYVHKTECILGFNSINYLIVTPAVSSFILPMTKKHFFIAAKILISIFNLIAYIKLSVSVNDSSELLPYLFLM